MSADTDHSAEPRRAAVALIIRVSPPPAYPIQPSTSTQPVATDLTDFFNLDWVNAPGARPEILFLQRENPQESSNGGRMNETGQGSREAHVAFPGEYVPCLSFDWYIDRLLPTQVAGLSQTMKTACILL